MEGAFTELCYNHGNFARIDAPFTRIRAMPTPSKPPSDLDRDTSQTLLILVVAGLGILALVGFAPLDQAHSLAHDARHLMGFPCH